MQFIARCCMVFLLWRSSPSAWNLMIGRRGFGSFSSIDNALLHLSGEPCGGLIAIFGRMKYKSKPTYILMLYRKSTAPAVLRMHISTILLRIFWKVACCKKCIILTPFARSPFPFLIWGYLLYHFFVWLKNNEDSLTTSCHCVLKNEKWWQSMIESFATRATH